jgi:UDP-N-acetylmuramoylalanine--D-glutamate ligase
MRLDELGAADILILGFGREGQATYAFLRSRWPDKPLTIADVKPAPDMIASDPRVTYVTGAHYEPAVFSAPVIVKTAGIPASLPLLRDAVANGARLTSHIEIFFSNYPRERIVGITGTKGKSTTTTLLFDMVRKAGIPSVLAGNIGAPPLPQVDLEHPEATVVCELSSHQLQPLTVSPHIAVLTNVMPEHLDYYASFDEYLAAKENITRFQSDDDWLVYASENLACVEIAGRTNAKTVAASAQDGLVESILPVHEVPLLGRFNLANVACAIAAARLLEVSDDHIRTAIHEYKGLPHRLERVGRFRDIEFFDDSIATVPEAAALAIEALGPRVQTLIAGGHDRGLTFEVLARAIQTSEIDTLILFPPTGHKIVDALNAEGGKLRPSRIQFVESMEEAVRLAFQHTDPDRICLLSPASASFGTFVDYADRGDQFKNCVQTLAG